MFLVGCPFAQADAYRHKVFIDKINGKYKIIEIPSGSTANRFPRDAIWRNCLESAGILLERQSVF